MFGDPPPWASDLRCRGCCRLRRRRPGAVRSRPTRCASWNPACPGPRGWGLCVRPLFRPDVGGVEDDAGDVDEAGVVELVQDRFVQTGPDSGSGPDEESSMGRGLRNAEAGWQRPPGATAHQYVDDRREQRLIRGVLGPTALPPHPRRRNQRLRDLPQPVRNNPTPRTPSHAECNDASPHRTRSKRLSHLAR